MYLTLFYSVYLCTRISSGKIGSCDTLKEKNTSKSHPPPSRSANYCFFCKLLKILIVFNTKMSEILKYCNPLSNFVAGTFYLIFQSTLAKFRTTAINLSFFCISKLYYSATFQVIQYFKIKKGAKKIWLTFLRKGEFFLVSCKPQPALIQITLLPSNKHKSALVRFLVLFKLVSN